MTTLAAACTVVPPHRYPQAEITEQISSGAGIADADAGLLRRLHGNAMVGHRHLVLPLERYRSLSGFTETNELFLTHAVELGERAIVEALAAAEVSPDEVDLVVSTTVTGIAVPSIEARIAGRIGMRPDVIRMPLFGLGCVAGAAGIARMHDYLIGHPDRIAVLLSVELCSLTLQRGDASAANLVASGLFGDGAAAVVALGSERSGPAGPRVVASRSHLYPDTLRTMGWDAGTDGLKIVLSAEVAPLVRRYLGDDVQKFLAEHGLTPADVTTWISHPGGPKVIEAIQSELDLPAGALDVTWQSLREVGNLSSASVLHVLAESIRRRPPGDGSPALLMAMGPGFCSELVLLQW